MNKCLIMKGTDSDFIYLFSPYIFFCAQSANGQELTFNKNSNKKIAALKKLLTSKEIKCKKRQ